MNSGKIKGLFIGDGLAPTGFATVMDNILGNLPLEDYEIHHLAINYWGDPHDKEYKVYPAYSPNHNGQINVMGYQRLPELFYNNDFDFIYILNDIWAIESYLAKIKEVFAQLPDRKIPKIVVYFPVDGGGYSLSWFKHADIVTKFVVYTKYGEEVVHEILPELALEIIPHGAANKEAFRVTDSLEAKREIFKGIPWLCEEDTFIVLNASRNQPRKRIDVALWGFALFARNKGNDVAYYHHAGIKDAGWHIPSLIVNLSSKLKMDLGQKVYLTDQTQNEQRATTEKLNQICNATDVGLNTSIGEGWNLVSSEHGYLGKPQVLPNHTAHIELYEEFGLNIPVNQVVLDPVTSLERYFVTAEAVADKLEYLYQNRDEMKRVGEATREKFSRPEYDWKEISKKWDKLLKSL